MCANERAVIWFQALRRAGRYRLVAPRDAVRLGPDRRPVRRAQLPDRPPVVKLNRAIAATEGPLADLSNVDGLGLDDFRFRHHRQGPTGRAEA